MLWEPSELLFSVVVVAVSLVAAVSSASTVTARRVGVWTVEVRKRLENVGDGWGLPQLAGC